MRFIEALSKVGGYASVVAVLAAVAIIIYEVFARYLFRWPTVWEIEASVLLIIFTTFVGSAFALKNNAHIKMDMIEERLKPGTRRKLSLVTSILSLAFCIVASVKGGQMWWEAYHLGWKSDSVWAPPLSVPYAFLPIGFMLMSLQYIVNIARDIEKMRRGDH